MTNQHKWDIRFLELAKHISQWSKDPSTKLGAIIVNDKHQVVGVGYNGFPRGVEDSDERLNDRPTKYAMVVHAEVNAILNASGNVEGCTIYTYPTLMLPNVCNGCAKAVIQSGIRRAVCYNGEMNERWAAEAEITKTMFEEGGVQIDMIEQEREPDVD